MPRTEFKITSKGETVASTSLETKVAICDFCSRPVGVSCFIAKDASLQVDPQPEDANPLNLKHIILNSDSHWAACDPCADLIRANDRQGLWERSCKLAPMGLDQALLAVIQATMFWAQFDGASHPGRDHPEHPEHRTL